MLVFDLKMDKFISSYPRRKRTYEDNLDDVADDSLGLTIKAV